ncbi:hypothetical protein GIB67_014264 [Kingdonia uniflora]|uniref:Uncharacterized protein n=1 Tax=Kingdonia uniflora TaxID=39325 RepID=A0A7J7M1Z9_9MAGN|nr:hypothetical protein GIB67_014264 [Kingdonia uniflora]
MGPHFKVITCLFMLALAITATSARILEEDTQEFPALSPEASNPVDTPVTDISLLSPPVVTQPDDRTATAPAEEPFKDASPVTTPALTQPHAGPDATTDPDHSLSFFMHDILGGSNPSARAVTGIVTNTTLNGQVPFSKPNGAVLPGNNDNNKIIDNNNTPSLASLGAEEIRPVFGSDRK